MLATLLMQVVHTCRTIWIPGDICMQKLMNEAMLLIASEASFLVCSMARIFLYNNYIEKSVPLNRLEMF